MKIYFKPLISYSLIKYAGWIQESSWNGTDSYGESFDENPFKENLFYGIGARMLIALFVTPFLCANIAVSFWNDSLEQRACRNNSELSLFDVRETEFDALGFLK